MSTASRTIAVLITPCGTYMQQRVRTVPRSSPARRTVADEPLNAGQRSRRLVGAVRRLEPPCRQVTTVLLEDISYMETARPWDSHSPTSACACAAQRRQNRRIGGATVWRQVRGHATTRSFEGSGDSLARTPRRWRHDRDRWQSSTCANRLIRQRAPFSAPIHRRAAPLPAQPPIGCRSSMRPMESSHLSHQHLQDLLCSRGCRRDAYSHRRR
jgi:hypothetical protein